MTDREKKIAEIREALEKATPRPWFAVKVDSDSYSVSNKPGYYGHSITGWGRVLQTKEDAHLIANAPEWLRWAVGEIERLRTALEEVYEELKTLHFMIDHDDDIFHERKKKYLSIIDYVCQSVAGQALSTTTEPCVCESIKCECGYHEPNGVERVRYAYTCPNCENLIEPEDASKAGMRCPTCRVKEIVPLTIGINAAKGDGNDA